MLRQLRKSAAAISFYRAEHENGWQDKPIHGAVSGKSYDVIFLLRPLY